MNSTYKNIYAAVKKIPKGRVATYGQIARLSGIPGRARQVGYALSALTDEMDVPWQRVVNAKGEISERPFAEKQHFLLKKEGIAFESNARIDLTLFQWKSTS